MTLDVTVMHWLSESLRQRETDRVQEPPRRFHPFLLGHIGRQG